MFFLPPKFGYFRTPCFPIAWNINTNRPCIKKPHTPFLKNTVFALALQTNARPSLELTDKTYGCSSDKSPINPLIFLVSFSAVGPRYSDYISFPISYLGSGGTRIIGNMPNINALITICGIDVWLKTLISNL